MGISFSIPCDPCINKVFHWIDEKVACTHNLKKNLAALEKTIGELKARREALLGRVKLEEDRGLQRRAEVQVWLTNAEAVEKETDDLFRYINDELHRLFLCGFCSKNLRSSYSYGKKVILTLREVEKLKRDVFEVVAEPFQPYVVQIQLQPIIVGQETMLDEAWKRILEDEVGIMGIYGMGGVGKTTLLTQLNNKFSKERSGFDFVIWIVVSKELNLEKIQDEIAEKVGLGGEKWKQKEKSQKIDVIYNFLRKKRFVLFLDDLWEKVDLAEIGVPFPTTENKCKVAFTTRSQDVCAYMKAKIAMEVQCLAEDEAFDLFEKKVGERMLGSDLEIHELARKVAGKCRGLPLALNVIGETMSCKRTVQEWRHAIDVLNEYASTFSGMEDKILPLLKYSYDNLKGKEVKSCLLYCALYPEDYKVLKQRLIHHCICEEIIDGSDGIERAENKGYEIIGSLVRASLLMECVDSDRRECVYMHDIVREMALWIASNLGKQKENFIVRKMPKVESWRTVRRLSLMENKIQNLVGSPECLELTTLLLQNTNLGKISSKFFMFMPMLAVLDLSKNQSLSKLPDGISKLVSLQYLSLSETGIHHLPKSLQRLKKLIHLDLGRTNLYSFAGISNLRNLKVLELYGSSLPWDHPIVDELKTLDNLEVLTLEMRKHPASLNKYLNSHKLVSCTRQLRIKYLYLKPSRGISLPVSMEKLREFSIWDCRIYEIKLVYNPRNPSFLSLSMVKIMQCGSLTELTFLMFLPNLKHLDVMDSNQLEDIINKEKACEGEKSGFVPFPRLISLGLINLPELKNIYWKPLPFPCLDEIIVNKCPNLKKLPFDSQSCTTGENGVIIRYSEKEWIEGVEWEDEATKTRFLSSCLQALINRCIQMKGDSDRGVGAKT